MAEDDCPHLQTVVTVRTVVHSTALHVRLYSSVLLRSSWVLQPYSCVRVSDTYGAVVQPSANEDSHLQPGSRVSDPYSDALAILV